MRTIALVMMLSFVFAAQALATDPAIIKSTAPVQKVQPKVNPKVLQNKTIPKTSIPYITDAHTETNSNGEWIYVVVLRNKGEVTVPANKLEVVVFRKTADKWTLMDTNPIIKDIEAGPQPGLVGNAVIVDGIFPRCCSTIDLIAKLRVRGTQQILDTKEFMATTVKTIDMRELEIDKSQNQFSVKIENKGSLLLPIILKVFASDGGKKTLLGEMDILLPHGEKTYNGICPGIKSRQYLSVEAYSPTTCIEPEEACLIRLISKQWI